MARDIKIRIDGDDSGYKRAASATDRSLDALGAKAKALGDGFSGAGRALLPLSGAITAVGAVAVKFAMDFNRSMANVATLIPGNTARVLELKTTVQDLAVATGKSTQDLSEGLYQVISAFGDTADSAKVLEINAKAAAAGVATTTDAINLTSAVTKAYGDTSAEAVQQVSDLAFQAVKLGQTSFPELAASIGRVTAMSTELSVEQEELFGVMATFTGVTGKAAEVSTQLRGVLQALQSPTDKMKTLFGELGVESGKALIEQRGLQGAIEAVVGEVKSSGGDLKDYIGSLEGQTLALSATGAMADTFTEKLGAMSDAVGATDEAFKEQTEGVNAAGFAWESFKQQVAVAAQNLGDELIPILVDAAKQMKPLGEAALDVIEKFKELPDPVKTAGVAIAVTFAAGAPAMLAMGAMANSVATLIRLYRTLAVVQVGGAAAGGLGLAGGVGVAAGVGAGVVGIGLLSADVENYIKQLEAAAEKERESARSSAAYADGLRSVIAAADPAATLISELSDAQKKAIVSAGTFDGTLGGLKLSLEQVKEGAKGATPPIRALTDAEKAHAKAIQDLSDTYTGQALAAKARDLTAAYVLAENQERLNAASTRAFAEEAMKLARGPLGPAALPERLHELWRAHVLLTNEVKSGTDAFDGLLDTLPRVEHLAQPIPPALGEAAEDSSLRVGAGNGAARRRHRVRLRRRRQRRASHRQSARPDGREADWAVDRKGHPERARVRHRQFLWPCRGRWRRPDWVRYRVHLRRQRTSGTATRA
jgi:TP901 family phage tail tape measure protein